MHVKRAAQSAHFERFASCSKIPEVDKKKIIAFIDFFIVLTNKI